MSDTTITTKAEGGYITVLYTPDEYNRDVWKFELGHGSLVLVGYAKQLNPTGIFQTVEWHGSSNKEGRAPTEIPDNIKVAAKRCLIDNLSVEMWDIL